MANWINVWVDLMRMFGMQQEYPNTEKEDVILKPGTLNVMLRRTDLAHCKKRSLSTTSI